MNAGQNRDQNGSRRLEFSLLLMIIYCRVK